MSVKIGSFNLRDFSLNRTGIDIPLIARIIHEQGFHIVALQEVLNPMTLKSLKDNLNHMGGKWVTDMDKPNQGTIPKQEYYAFIWNEDKVQLARKTITRNGVSAEIEVPPMIANYKNSSARELARDPYYARFWPKREDYSEIRLINVHLKSNNYTVYERNKEFKIIADRIYHALSKDAEGTRSKYTIMLGDYNLNLKRQDNIGNLLEEEEYCINDTGRLQIIKTVQDKKTTLRDSSTQFANNFDHFSYDSQLDDVVVSVDVVDSVHAYCEGSYKDHFEKVSDHIPITVTIDARGNR